MGCTLFCFRKRLNGVHFIHTQKILNFFNLETVISHGDIYLCASFIHLFIDLGYEGLPGWSVMTVVWCG